MLSNQPFPNGIQEEEIIHHSAHQSVGLSEETCRQKHHIKRHSTMVVDEQCWSISWNVLQANYFVRVDQSSVEVGQATVDMHHQAEEPYCESYENLLRDGQ